ncbi:bifunctional methylenetetrahydrofolate dehydrogenase/cyclohydrolase, mitochondrial-like isoform X2 [Calliopsis andreniformis]|uniref:bifunctional methylenetetrahydrofolate dehydrogenase/cyclohydrolase, mitochondrial-like isoform X2 n=1 Tax=Calliopsis andreniformis TaxID=337506 RepID=UPI003FCCE49E
MLPWRKVLTATSQSLVKQLHTSKVLKEAVVLNGKQIANEIQNELKTVVDAWINENKKRPTLVAILVGNNPASKVYIKRKMNAAKAIGIESYTLHLEDTIVQQDLINEINRLNADEAVDGIFVQLPLAEHIDEYEVSQAVAPNKDVDGFHLENLGKLTVSSSGIVPATALAIKELIIRSKMETFGKNAVIVGRSKHIGLPVALQLHADDYPGALDMTTTICHRHTPHTELEKFTKLADLLVVATGIPGLITKEMVKPGACVIDVGITRVKVGNKYKLVGDVDFENVKTVAGYITPVPGGVGPLTVAMAMKNTISLAMKNHLTSK